MNIGALTLLPALTLAAAPAQAATPASLRIAQAFAAGTEITAYVAARDAGDAPVVGLLLEDLASTNGTLLNGVPVTAPQPLDAGDVIRIGQTALRVGGIE